MDLGAAAASIKAWLKTWIQPTHAAGHRPPPHVIVVRNHDEEEAAELRIVDLHGNVIKSVRIQQPIAGRLSIHGDLLCASYGWRLTSVVDMVTGTVDDVGVDPRKKVNSAAPYCVLGHVPATGEYKVLRIQADYCCRLWRQMCEVVTLGGGGSDAGSRWRRRTCPPVTLRIKPWCSSWNAEVAAGLAYFLANDLDLEADRLVVFDLAMEEWKPVTLQGPMTSSLRTSDEEADDRIFKYIDTYNRPILLHGNCFQLTQLDETLVVLYCNFKKTLTQLWFLEDMVDEVTARWSKRYTLQCTPFGDDRYSPVLQYHYPLAVLEDGRILVWVVRTSALKAYDPKTCTWSDLAMLTGDCVVGMHHGSLDLCSNVREAQP